MTENKEMRGKEKVTENEEMRSSEEKGKVITGAEKTESGSRRKGILFILMAAFFFSMMSIFVRLSGDVPTMQKAFFRNIVAAVVAVVILLRSEERVSLHRQDVFPLLMRCVFGTAGILANFWAVDHLGIADANMLNKLSPFFAILMSIFILGEKPNRIEWLSVLFAFIGAAFVAKPSILQSVRLVPYYFPLSASSLMESLGVEREVVEVSGMSGEGEMRYPLHPLQKQDSTQLELPNIVVILIDSWSRQSLTPECMPNMWQLAHEEQWYKNHVSCGNGTSFSVFGMFTGLQPYYWTAYQSARLSPLLVDRLLELGYDFRVYPSAGLQSPPFDRLLFQHVPNLRLDTPLPTSYERDLRIKDDFIADMPQLKAQKRPFFTFIFFDLLHAYSLPKELLNRFQPSWEYGRFDELHNDMDPTPFWNLYRNSAYQTDKMVHEVITNLKEQGLYDNSLVFITGDHAQEYNENHKNYWGHNSNFSQYQIGVPLIVHQPDHDTTAVYTHRTTHYDFVPTIMHNYLGIKNPLEDYTAGRLLSDKTPRLWHFVGNELRYAFIVEGDTILTKEGAGYIEVTDSKLNPVDNYRIRPKEFDKAIKDLNRFFNQ